MIIDSLTGYLCRIRALKGDLIARDRMEDMLEANELEFMIEVLLNSHYASFMAEALAHVRGVDAVEDALSRRLTQSLSHLEQLAPDAFHEAIEHHLFRFDLQPVKALLRFIHQQRRPERMQSAPLTGPHLSKALAVQFAQSENMETLVNRLAAWQPGIFAPLLSHLPAYRQTGELDILEDAVDRSYFQNPVPGLPEEDKNLEALEKTRRMEIDRINLRMIFELFRENKASSKQTPDLMTGGDLSHLMMMRLAGAASITDAMELLEPTPYSSFVERLYEIMTHGRFSPLERQMDRLILFQLRRLTLRLPLTLALFAYYVALKVNEVTNLRLIARGHHRHLPHGRVREELVFI